MRPLALLAFALIAALPSPGRADNVSNFQCGTAHPTPVAELPQTEAAYGERSIAIIAASLSGDKEMLKRIVAPEAKTTIFHFDSGLASPSIGPESLLYFAKEIGPRRYEILRERGAPVVPGDPCGQVAVKVTLKSIHPEKSYVATFHYQAAILVSVEAQDADLVEGEFAWAAAKLSATDLRDLRCLYAFESRAVAERASGEADKSDADQNVAQWFRGRLSVSQPSMSTFKYLKRHFYDPKVVVTYDDIVTCAAVIGTWQAREIGPIN